MQVTFDALQTMSITTGAVVLIAVANPPIIAIFLPLAYLLYKVRVHNAANLACPQYIEYSNACTRHTSYLP